MDSDFLSDVELYLSNHPIENNRIIIDGEERHHIVDVMRHKTGENIYVSDGKGSIHISCIKSIDKKFIEADILETKFYENKFPNITFCIPRLKSVERFEFALEKCVELGITNFIVFECARTIAKGEKLERWQKILSSAMKQSLRSWLPKINYAKSYNELMALPGKKIVFDQSATQTFSNYLTTNNKPLSNSNYLIFGPEGGLTGDELRLQNVEYRVKLTGNRLRSETAIVTAASILTLTNI